MTLTHRERTVATAIRDHWDAWGEGPTLQEIGDLLGISKNTVYEYIRNLDRKGWLAPRPPHEAPRPPHEARRLKLADGVQLPDDRPARIRIAVEDVLERHGQTQIAGEIVKAVMAAMTGKGAM